MANTDNNAPVFSPPPSPTATEASAKLVQVGDKVKVEYIGKFPDGNVFDKSEGRGPLEFTTGLGQVVPGFDEAVIGMGLNEEKTVTIPPEKAYGTDEEAERTGQRLIIPVTNIQGDSNQVHVGLVLYSANGEKGKIIDITDGNATIVIMHPLSGQTLIFWIKVVDIQKKK